MSPTSSDHLRGTGDIVMQGGGFMGARRDIVEQSMTLWRG